MLSAPVAPADPRDAPSEQFIREMRERYPVEPEIDRLLTRRMQRRGGPPYRPVTLPEMVDCVERMLGEQIDGPFQISDARWLAGGASKIQMRFTLDWRDPELGQRAATDLVVRMEPTESLNASSRRREFEVVRAMAGTVPVPQAHWVDADAEWFPEPALIYAFAHGVTKPSGSQSGAVTGIGTNFGPQLRGRLAGQFARHLGQIHAFDHGSAALHAFARPALGTTQTAQWQLHRARRVWEEDRGEEMALMDVAAGWLARNLPVLDRSSVLHGDYRSGNFLFDESTGQITSWLDWERAYIGDRHSDLAWASSRALGHLAQDGETFLVCGLMPLEEFFAVYEQTSGLPVDPDRLRFYGILNRYQQVETVLGTSYRVARLGKSHQGIVLTRLEGAAYVLAEELRADLEAVL